MLISEILSALTASLEWMVLFNLSAIRQIVNDTTISAMYHLPAELNLDNYSHVVLSSEGRFLAAAKHLQLIEPISGRSWTREDITTSLSTVPNGLHIS